MERGSSTQPKLFCEQFELDVVVDAVEAAPLGENIKGKTADTPEENGRFGGLCRNCENRYTCKIRRPEGNIWHCEEYC